MFLESIKNNCLLLGNKPAYISCKEMLTYFELWDKASRLANYLNKNGNTPVIVYGHKNPYMLVSFLACMISGRTYVPCDTSLPPDRIRYYRSITNTELILATETFHEEDITVLSKDEILKICSSGDICDVVKNPGSAVYTIFTSGSTGKPKGAPISASNLDNFVNWVTDIPEIARIKSSVILNQASFSFDLSVADIFISLVQGNTLFALTKDEQSNYTLLFRRLSESCCRLVICTPSFIQLCLCDKTFDNKLLPFLDTIFFCGEVLPVSIVKELYIRFPDIKIINAYGPTEATCAVTSALITRDMLSSPSLTIGKVENSAVYIKISGANSDGIGDITLCGKSVFNGYIDEPCKGLIKKNNNTCYLTGDYGYIKDGYIYYCGRKDNRFKYKGYRIEPEEIEAVLRTIPEINNAFVIPVYNKYNRVICLTAFIETCVKIGTDKINTELIKLLPEYMIPKNYVFTDHIPLNSSSKSSRKFAEEIVDYGKTSKEDTC